METNHLYVFDVESKDEFIARDSDVPWNAAGTATTWDVRWPFPYKTICTGPANDNLMIIEVSEIALPPKRKISSELILDKGTTYWNLTNVNDIPDTKSSLQQDTRVLILAAHYDMQEEKWLYICVDSHATNLEMWEFEEVDILKGR